MSVSFSLINYRLCSRYIATAGAFLLLCTTVSAKVMTYPAPPGLVTSKDFTVKVNNMPVWVERAGSKLKTLSYELYSGREMEDLNIANFSCEGPQTIVITASSDIKSYIIRPKSRNIEAKVHGNQLSFTIPGPQKLYIEINDLPHLAIFSNPPEEVVPGKGDPGVMYFEPGSHSPGDIILKSNQIIYIAGGAIVYADIKGKDVNNVKILGRGSLQGKIKIDRAENLEVNGIFIRNTKGWTNTLTDCHQCIYRNVKVFGYEDIYSVDGINPVSCTKFIIDDCFMRCRDDCVAIKSMNYDLRVDSIMVTNNVMVGWACSDGVTIGFELNGGPVENILVRNCDILYARGGGRTGGHSAFSIVCDGPAVVRNIMYEDIRIEEHVEFKSLELIVTDGTLYGKDLPGHIKGVYMKDIHWENNSKPFIITGFSSDNMAEDITFENCSIGGKPLKSTQDAEFRMNEYVKNLNFLP